MSGRMFGLFALVLLAGILTPAGAEEGLIVATVQEKGRPEARPQPETVGGTFKIDPVHSSNVFRIKHMNVAWFYGRFNEIEGSFTLDEEKPEKSAFHVALKTASVSTANADRDKHLRSPDFFDAEKFPEITFRSTSVKQAGERAYEVSGELMLHGVAKPLTARIEISGAGVGRQGEFRTGWETTFEIKRSAFGMTTSLGPLGDDVRITVSVQGVRE